MTKLRAALLLLTLGLSVPPLLAASDTPARVEVSLTQTAATNPPVGANEFGDPGGTQFSAGNLIPDSGFEPISMRHRVRVSRTGTEHGYTWFEFDENGGITGWDLTTTGLFNGASVRVYRIVDADGQPLPVANPDLDLTNAAAYMPVGTATVPEVDAANLPLGGWVDTAYSMPNSVFGTRANLDYTDARWIENGKTYYYIVTAIGSNSTDVGGANESDPALATELTATPQAGLPSTPHLYAANGDGFNEIGSVQAEGWFNFQPALAGATGPVTWALLDENNQPYTPPAGLAFNGATGEFGGSPTATPPTTRLRFRATAANGTATRDFILNNPAWTTTGGTTRPLPPTNLTATAGDGYVHLTWSPSPTAGIVGYRVYRAEMPRAQQRQRVYLAGAPALSPLDYVHLEKRLLTADPQWAHPRVRSGVVGDSWRSDFGAGLSLRRVAHTAAIPPAFRFPGESCMQATATTTGEHSIGGPYIFYPANASGEAQWYSQLEPGRTYRFEAWMRQTGLGNGGQVRLGLNSFYSAIGQTVAVTGDWQLLGFTFTAPPRPTESASHSCPAIGFTGPGTLWLDNIRLFRADTPAAITESFTPPSPLVYDELMASQPLTGEKGLLRSMYVLLNKATMASCLSLHRDAGLVMNWYQSAEGAGNMTVPYFLQYAFRSGATPATRLKPWLNISSHMREDEWLALIEYLGAPIDPASPADVAAKPWAYLRYQQRGVTTPWTDEFPRIYLEFANETWHNGAVSDEWFGWGLSGWVHGGAREFGLAAHYLTSHVNNHSPYYAALNAAGKLRFVMGSNYIDYGEIAAAGAPLTHAIAHTTYVGPKWEVGETPLATYDDHGIQATLLGHAADTALVYVNYRRQREQLAAAGHTMDLLAYEGGPSGYALPGTDTPQQHDYSERYGKSLAMGVAALDAWLAANEAGFSDQAYLGMGIGDYWSSHTPIVEGYRPHAGWLALTLRNRFASGRMIRSEVVQAPTITWDAAEYPLVSSYAFRDGNRLGVFLLSRKLGGTHDGTNWGDGSTPVTLVLPGNPTGPATLYHLSGDPRATNLDALNVTIQQTTATLGRETTVTLPQGSIYLYVVDTDLPARDDPPAPPATTPTHTYTSTGTTLSWPAVAGASGYTIFRSALPYFDRGDVTATFTSAATSYTDPGAGGGTTYYYRVASNNAWGTGFWTLVAAGGTNPATPVLPAPALDGLLETTGALVASWHEVPGATGYQVGIGTKSGGPYTWTDAGIATSWTFANLENAHTYYVAVYAFSVAGRSPDSAERSGTPLTAGQTAVLSAWEAAELNYSANLSNPPTTLPVARHLLAVGASSLTRGPGLALNTNNYGFEAGQSGSGSLVGHYDGKFPFEPATDSANFGATSGGSLANMVARNAYLTCTVTPATGQSVSISGLDTGFQYSFGSRETPIRYLQVVLRYRVGTGEWHDVAAPNGYAVEAGFWFFNDLSLALAGETALQHITQPVELRFYLYWTGEDARWHPASLIRSSGEDLILRGTSVTVAAPGQPAGLRAAAGRHQVAVSWTPVAGATSYTLRWGTAPGTYTGSMTGLTQVTATIPGLPGGVPHFFSVEALNSFGSSVASTPISATPLTSFQSWQAARFTPAQIGSGLGAATADPDADGRSNLVEYAFGADPLLSDPSPCSIGLNGAPARLAATFPLWADNDDITVTVEASGDLINWTPLARSTAGTTMTALAGGITINTAGSAPASITVLDNPTNATATRRFFRVSVTAP